MFENLLNHITYKFYDHSDDPEEIEVFKYGLEAIISSISGLGLALFLCALIKEATIGALFMLILTPIKLMFSSYHCNHRSTCLITYSSVVLVNVYLYYHIQFNIFFALIALSSICILKRNEMTRNTWIMVIIYFFCLFLFNSQGL